MGTPKIDKRTEQGRRAEDAVAALYESKGYRILDRNWLCRGGELDLIVAQHDVVAFVEVRSVSTDFLPGAELSVTPAKQAGSVALQSYGWVPLMQITEYSFRCGCCTLSSIPQPSWSTSRMPLFLREPLLSRIRLRKSCVGLATSLADP